MLEEMKGVLSDVKDHVVCSGAKALINQKIAKVGECTHLDIDTRARIISATLLFKGESDSVKMRITSYSIMEIEGQCYAQMGGFESSRPWLTAIAKGLVVGSKIKISRKLYDLLRMLL